MKGESPIKKIEVKSEGRHFVDEEMRPWEIKTEGEIFFPELKDIGLSGERKGGVGGLEIKTKDSISGGGGKDIVRAVTDEERFIPVGGKKSFGSKEQVVAVVVKEVAKGSMGDVSLVGGTRDVGRLEFKSGTEKFDNYNYSKGRFGLKERRARRSPLYELEYEQPSTYWKGVAPGLGSGIAPSLATRNIISNKLDVDTLTGTRDKQLTETRTELGTILLGGTRLGTELLGGLDLNILTRTDLSTDLTTNLDTDTRTDLSTDFDTKLDTELSTEQTTEQLTTQITIPRLTLITPTILTPDITTPEVPIERPRPPEDKIKKPWIPWIPLGGDEEEPKEKKYFKPVKRQKELIKSTSRRRAKGLMADLLSVTQSQARYGKSTQPKLTTKLWKESEKSLFKRVPTQELMKGGRTKADNLIGNKKKGGKKNVYY
jgi:hypothetical protein